jgi:hypothetical protein
MGNTVTYLVTTITHVIRQTGVMRNQQNIKVKITTNLTNKRQKTTVMRRTNLSPLLVQKHNTTATKLQDQVQRENEAHNRNNTTTLSSRQIANATVTVVQNEATSVTIINNLSVQTKDALNTYSSQVLALTQTRTSKQLLSLT